MITVRTQSGEYQAKRLIVTVGPWLPTFLPSMFRDRLRITRQVMYWFPISDDCDHREDFSPERMPVFIWQLPAPQSIYGFPAIDGLERGVKIATEQYDLSTDPELVDRNVSARETKLMYETYVAPYFSGLSGEALKTKVCLYTCAPAARFLIDRVGSRDNVIVASACSGHGFKHGPAVGEYASARILDDVAAEPRFSLGSKAEKQNRSVY